MHTLAQPQTCSFCGLVLDSIRDLVRHLKREHVGAKSFVCEFPGCGRKFQKVRELEPHYKRCHACKSPAPAEPSSTSGELAAETEKRAQVTGESPAIQYPNFFYTRMLPMPMEVATNGSSVGQLAAFPEQRPVQAKDITEPLQGTFTSSLWFHEDID